jgi:hypothetical protein
MQVRRGAVASAALEILIKITRMTFMDSSLVFALVPSE